MGSYQDCDSRVGVIERKMDFLFKLMTFTKRTPSTLMPGEFLVENLTLDELYREVSNSGGLKEVTTDGPDE